MSSWVLCFRKMTFNKTNILMNLSINITFCIGVCELVFVNL
jgi:hypothetical protein